VDFTLLDPSGHILTVFTKAQTLNEDINQIYFSFTDEISMKNCIS
jgi:hypothetical protein